MYSHPQERRQTSASIAPDYSALYTRLRSELGAEAVSRRPIDRHALAHDASHYLLTPRLVVRPSAVEDVETLMRACGLAGAPLTFRAGGTSLSGQAVTDSVLVDIRRHFRGAEVLDQGARVRVEPGVTVRAVNAMLAPYRRRLGPDPASEGACTIGGVIANNSSGMRCGIEANTYATLESMVFTLPTGTTIDSAAPDANDRLRFREPALFSGISELRTRVLHNPESVRSIRRLFAMKNTMGFGVNAFLDYESPLDILVRLMIGSEGALGFVSSATFRTVPVRSAVATGLLVFDSISEAASSVPALVATQASAAELMDSASLRVAKEDPRCPPSIAALRVANHAAMLVEWEGDSQQELEVVLHDANRTVREMSFASPPRVTKDSTERASLWRVRKNLFSTVAAARPYGTHALLEDVVVRVDVLGEASLRLAELFDTHGYENSVVFGHARDGNLHFMLNERFDDAASLRRYESFTDDLVDLILGMGGGLKAEHGTGRIMAPFVRRQYGNELYEVMREVKRLIDPHRILNPGVALSDDPASYLRDLKKNPPVEDEVDRCVECGYCEPVCPSKDITLTPRQRIVVRRDIQAARAEGKNELADSLERDYDYAGVQTCAVDGMCQVACPVLIDTGDLTRRLRSESANRVARRGWVGAAHVWGALSSMGGAALSVAGVMPSAIPRAATRVARTIAGAEAVPLYDGGLPRGGFRRSELTSESPTAVLFSACVNQMFGPVATGRTPDRRKPLDATRALIELCGRAGVSLRTPEGLTGLCCGTPWSSKGMTSGYDVMRDRVAPALWTATDAARLPVVIDASSCAEGLQKLLMEVAPEIVVIDSIEFVRDALLPRLKFEKTVETVIVHPTCSSERAGTSGALIDLAGAVSDDVIVPNSWGCCGFAGDRGLLHPELTASATEAEATEVAAVSRSHVPEYVSSNRTCEIGMTRATGHTYRHILQLLADAPSSNYGDAAVTASQTSDS